MSINREDTNRMCKELGTTRESMIYRIIDLDAGNMLVDDYIKDIAENVVDEVVEDIYECADKEHWNDADIRIAFSRVLCTRLGVEM